MNIINETTDILLSSGYSEYCILADRDIEISFRGYEKSEEAHMIIWWRS